MEFAAEEASMATAGVVTIKAWGLRTERGPEALVLAIKREPEVLGPVAKERMRQVRA